MLCVEYHFYKQKLLKYSAKILAKKLAMYNTFSMFIQVYIGEGKTSALDMK